VSVGTTASPPRMDPRIRLRRVAVTRQRGRRRLRVVVAFSSTLAVLVCAVLVLYDTALFAANHVSIRGETHTSASEILLASGLSSHPPLVDVDTAVISRRVDALPWILSSQVERHWPDSVSIAVVERRPAATVVAGRGVTVLDRSGRILGTAAVAPSGTVALVAAPGGKFPVGRPGTLVGASAAPAIAVAAALPPSIRPRVVAVDSASGGRVDLDLGHGITAVLGTTDQLLDKFEALASVLAGASITGPATIDVTVPDEPVVTSRSA
jgi:cell division protein FtsQ